MNSASARHNKNKCVYNNKASKYIKKKPVNLMGEIYKPVIIVYLTSFYLKLTEKKVSKIIEELNTTIKCYYLIDIYRTLFPRTEEFISF